jgi:hypothetical protein
MTDLIHIARDPKIYRDNLTVRGAAGPAIFSSIVQPFQTEILDSIDIAFCALREDRTPPVTRIWAECSKGAGKDSLAAMMVLWLLAFTDRALVIQIGAADKSQGDELRRAAVGILRANDWLCKFVESQNWVLVNHATGSRAEIIPADEAGAHGSRPDVTILNELVHHGSDGFAATCMDNSAKVSTNVSIILTNAGSIGTWQWRWREMARTSARWRFHRYDQPAPWVNSDELNERRISTSESRFRRLWHGQWAHENESALSDAAIEAAIILPGPRICREANDEQVFGGLDIGVSQDRTGFAVLTRAPEERTKLAYCRSWTPPKGGKVNLMEVEEAVFEAHQRFSFFVIYYDPSQCELAAQRLRTRGVPMTAVNFNSGSLQEMASVLIETFNSGTIELFPHVQLLADLRALRFIERGNAYRLDAARTSAGHADLATAFVLALLASKRNPNPWIDVFARDAHPMISLDDLLRRRDEMKLLDDQPAHPSALQRLAQELPRPADRQPAQMTPLAAALAENGLLNW